ncbi:DUF29 domain-containing protein [Candidatus Fukatsuia symbiotica]|uniref:DUF29 domain-containing protein n=1 Tax=Candidatus Fukatsuia symbiotica TaxID=1878942 RepID=A0A2U8I2N7_9GAMM|nr:DUF29 domain-containing protein [Candidatus Fukatsuia symbiotica]AWK13369.1 DUF29 domain-containing protein [Candidatus Fukatsuia symbiotica]MEA9444258.1 DUF29 domain-containing protein [Candidatus Fukatsuia symbiotica]
MATRYDSDFHGWTQEQANLLRANNLNQLDTKNLLEEIESMGRSERRELRSRLEILLAYLLKWQYQPEKSGRSWQLTIEEQRAKIMECLDDSPSLKNKLNEHLEKAYASARRLAENETQMSQSIFPKHCPWTFEQIISSEFFPD